MKKRIIKFITILTVLVIGIISVATVTGCGLVTRNYQRVNARTIATIQSYTQYAEVNRNAVIIDGQPAFLEFIEFGADRRAIVARQLDGFGNPVLTENGDEIRFDIFTGRQIIAMNDARMPHWGSVQLNNENRDHVFAFLRGANGDLQRTTLSGEFAGSAYTRDHARIRNVPYTVPFTTPEIRIYQAQLVQHFNQFAGQFLNQGMTVEETVDQLMDIIINQELVLMEADREMFVENIYFTVDDVDTLQRQIYQTVDGQILRHKNQILERNNDPQITAPTPAPPEDTDPDPDPPARHFAGRNTFDNNTPINRSEYRWHDGWYLNDAWFLHDGDAPMQTFRFRHNGQMTEKSAFAPNPRYMSGFPGMHGDASDRSLAREAVNAFLEEMLDVAQNLIGLTEYNDMDEREQAQRDLIDKEASFLRHIRDTRGIEFVYPLLGSTMTFKLLIGDQALRQWKMEQLQMLITNEVNVSDTEVGTEWQNRLADQRTRFGGINNIPVDRHAYSAAVGNELILWTPTNRYLWVKHILLPFTDREETALSQWDNNNRWEFDSQGRPRDEVRREFRDNLAMNMNVYRNVIGEFDAQGRPVRDFNGGHETVAFAINEIYATLAPYRNHPHLAEEAMHELIAVWNNDPGIFNNMTGYQTVYRLEEGESETFMQEFADAAREFRTRGFSLGQLLTDENGDPQLAITDFGIHVMFYAADPFYFRSTGAANIDRVNHLDCYITPGRHETVRQFLHSEMLNQRRNAFYNNWEEDYIRRLRRTWLGEGGRAYHWLVVDGVNVRRRYTADNGQLMVQIVDELIEDLVERWHEQIFGR